MMKKKIPKFKSEDEEARYWDTHSPLDYPDEFIDVEEPFKFAPALLERAGKKARYQGIKIHPNIKSHDFYLTNGHKLCYC